MSDAGGAGRLDRVRVATSLGTLELPWDSREILLERLEGIDGARAIIDAFVSVGASRPVELGREEAGLLVSAITSWAHFAGALRLPPGLWDLRNALAEDLRVADE